MNIFLAYVSAFIITALLIKDLPSVSQWFPLALIIIIFDGLYQAFFMNSEAQEQEPDKKSALKQAKNIWCEWKGCSVVLYEDDIVIARMKRDRFGNLSGVSDGSIDGYINCRLERGKNHCFTHVHFKCNQIIDHSISWKFGNGGNYADVSIEHGWMLSGSFEIYFEDGSLKKSGFLINGKPDGRVKTYHPGGQLKKVLNYKNGVREGDYEIRTENGEAIETGSYENARLSGYVLRYFESGGMKEEIYYRCGVELMKTVYRPDGGVEKDRVSDALALAGAKDKELKGLKRLARVREKLGKHGLELYNGYSAMFPRDRAIRIAGGQYILREFSCEEELIKTVLDKEKFDVILERLKLAESGKKTVWYYNEKGKLVRERRTGPGVF